MDWGVYTTCSDSEEDALQEADDFMGECTVNISKENTTPDIKRPDIKKQRIIEAGKQEPVTREDPGKSTNELQIESSNAKTFASQILNPGGSEVQKKQKRKRKNLIEDGQDQASNLVNDSGHKIPFASGGSSSNTFQTYQKQSSQTPEEVMYMAVFDNWIRNYCKECNIGFKTSEYLKQHRLKAHSSKYSFRCPDCSKIFSSPGATIQHRVAMHNAENIFQCAVCNAVLISPSSLNQHHKTYHGFSIKCSTCNKTFSSFSLLRQHQFEAHNTGIQLKCAICFETFSNYNELMNHRNSHMFECTVCNSTFNKLAKLRRHEQKHAVGSL